jgi:hypothetical protein
MNARIALVGINYAPELTGIAVYHTGLAAYLPPHKDSCARGEVVLSRHLLMRTGQHALSHGRSAASAGAARGLRA